MKTGYLKKDMMERYNSKRGWFVNAWRIVDENGKDMVQPWPNTKSEARRLAVQLGIELKGEFQVKPSVMLGGCAEAEERKQAVHSTHDTPVIPSFF